ncbi:MAG: DnaA/Hda family protein [Nitrosomonadales bacterium]|jgi:DnaA family protein
MEQLTLDILKPPPKSFDNFYSDKNEETVTQLKIFDSELNDISHIYLWGEEGSGKSHLLSSFRNKNILLQEDIQFLNESEQIQLFNKINEVRSNNKKLIMTGNLSPKELNIREDLRSRIQWGLVLRLVQLTDEEKKLVIYNQSIERGLKIDKKVIDFCLTHLKRDMHTLLNTLEALDNWSLKTKRAITIPLIKELIKTYQE